MSEPTEHKLEWHGSEYNRTAKCACGKWEWLGKFDGPYNRPQKARDAWHRHVVAEKYATPNQ